MPPKAPNLKFKPKLVARAEEPVARPSAAPSTDDLSLVQLARLQGLYVEEQPPPQSPAPSGMAPDPAASASALSHAASGRSGGGGGGGGGGVSAAGAGAASAASPLLRPKGRSHLSAHAALEEASRRRVDMSQFPDAAPPLPVNTMNAIVQPEVAHPDDVMRHSGLYPPLPLDASLPARLAAEAAAVAPPEPLSSSPPPATAPVGADGTAFLREAVLEQQRAYAANRRFYEDHLRPAQTGLPGTSTAGGGLVWMQLPQFHDHAPFSFFQLPPGKVGELKVLRSGRMVLEVAGVYYDVAVEGYEDAGDDGACAMAVATQPSAYPANPASKASCYELGLLEKKLVCTPTLP